jgi:hypothetical protein
MNLFSVSRMHSSFTTAILLASAWFSQVVQGQPVTMTSGSGNSTIASVNTSRPLAEILDAIQQKYLVPITFEEAPFESNTDLKAFPIKQLDGSIFTFHELPVVDFSVTLDNGETAVEATQSVLTAYASLGLPGVYDMVQEADRIRVFPKQVRASTGNMRNVTPVMDYPVAFPLATRGSVETLQLLVSIISKESGTHVEALNVPFNLEDTLTLGASGESARTVIEHLSDIFHIPFSFQCLYVPTEKTYYLNVKGVFVPNPPGMPAEHGYIRPLPAAGPANSLWFTKKQPQP